MSTKPTIGVAFSGGVDSAVCVRLLQECGFDVTAWHMLTCHKTVDEATISLAAALDVPLKVLDFQEVFEQTVVAPFFKAYAEGFTPNPCLCCNARLKFGLLREAIGGLMATGHYVRLSEEPQSGEITLQCGADPAKDQSYFLYDVPKETFSSVVFPLGNMTRAQVVALAQKWQLPIPERKLAAGSQDVCFLPEGDYRPELCRRHPETARPGNVLDMNGKVIGRHQGLATVTRGQRKGLGIATGGRAFAVGFNRTDNTITLGPKEALEVTAFKVGRFNWMVTPTFPLRCHAVTRYHHRPVMCTVHEDGTIIPDTPLTLVTPGQACVFYRDEWLLGGAFIETLSTSHS
jgi:tRNA-specific 2-thiouridylase